MFRSFPLTSFLDKNTSLECDVESVCQQAFMLYMPLIGTVILELFTYDKVQL